ncbi:hypothetical protein GE253_12980 [Niveispirillum sp. SYP-B3756]|nr:hypothetical protein [Niveispirillum sp. SYP-B3756]
MNNKIKSSDVIKISMIWPYIFDIFFISFILVSRHTVGEVPNFNGRDDVLFISFSLLYIAIIPLYGARIAVFIAIFRKYKKPMILEKNIAKASVLCFLALIVPGFMSSSLLAYAHGYKSCFRVDRKMPIYLYVPKNKECPAPPTADQYHGITPNPYMEMFRAQ